MISLTDEQREAVRSEQNSVISACPGSGKTRVIIAKLLLLADEVVETPRSIGCITYTNAAVDEITDRLKQAGSSALADACDVSTIHSFCLKYIVRPYRWLEPEIPESFKILTRDADIYNRLVRAVEDEIGRRPSYRAFNDYASLNLTLNGEATGTGITQGVVTEQTARRYHDLMRHHGYIDFAMILYYAYRILDSHPFVAKGLSSKFCWLLVDEFQDTTDVQTEILSKINAQNFSQFFLVGDEHQSINAFAGARPDLADSFSTKVGARRDLSLSGNFRCSPAIVESAEMLIPRTPAMHSNGEAARRTGHISRVVASQPQDGVENSFIPTLMDEGIELGSAAILAPQWDHLIPVARRLRQQGIPVVGPGARPYRRSRLFATLAEQLGACAHEHSLSYVPSVERAIYALIINAMGLDRRDIFSFQGRCTALKLVYLSQQLASVTPSGKEWLCNCAEQVASILVDDEWIDGETASLLIASVDEMLNDMSRTVDVDNLELADLGIFANPHRALKLLTLHNSKGREFDAVAIINANEGHIPHYRATSASEVDEARRLFYVGITRAKNYVLLVTDRADRRNRPSRFIGAAGL